MITTGIQLQAAINTAPIDTQTTIQLDVDIELTDINSITIPENRNIILTPAISGLNVSLIGSATSGLEVINVAGRLVINSNGDGRITITRPNQSIGRGILNTGFLEIFGAVVTGHTSRDHGAGIRSTGTLNFIAGEISNNISLLDGGGISDGGILRLGTDGVTGGRRGAVDFIGNTAQNGGAVWTIWPVPVSNPRRLEIGNVWMSNNRASRGIVLTSANNTALNNVGYAPAHFDNHRISVDEHRGTSSIVISQYHVLINDSNQIATLSAIGGSVRLTDTLLRPDNLPDNLVVSTMNATARIVGNRINQSTTGIYATTFAEQAVVIEVDLSETINEILSHQLILLDRNFNTVMINVGRTGTINVNRNNVPTAITISQSGDNVLLSGVVPNRDPADVIEGIFELAITRDGITELVMVYIRLITTPLEIDPIEVIIDEVNTTQVITVNGTATGNMTIGIVGGDANLWPGGVWSTINNVGNTFTVATTMLNGVASMRPLPGGSRTSWTRDRILRREGHSFIFPVTVSMEPHTFIPTPTSIVVNDMNLIATITVEGSLVTMNNGLRAHEVQLQNTPTGGIPSVAIRNSVQFVVRDFNTLDIYAIKPLSNASAINFNGYLRIAMGTGSVVPITISLSPMDAQLNINPSFITMATLDQTISRTINLTPINDFVISVNIGLIPFGVTAEIGDNEVTITANRQEFGSPDMVGVFPVIITRNHLSEILYVSLNIPAWPSLELDPNSITINDTTLNARSAVLGTATGMITSNNSTAGSTVPMLDPMLGGVRVDANNMTNEIVLTGGRPMGTSPAIVGTFEQPVIRAGVTEILEVNINLTPQDHTLTINNTTLNVTNTSLNLNTWLGGNATGEITIDEGDLPEEVVVRISGTTVNVSATRSERDVVGSYVVNIFRQGIFVALTINVNITALTFSLDIDDEEEYILLNDDNLQRVIDIEGTATGVISVISNNLPSNVTVSTNQTLNTVTLTATRPAAHLTPVFIDGEVTFGRAGREVTIKVVIDLTPIPFVLTLSEQTISITNANLSRNITMGGTATGVVMFDRGDLTNQVQFTVSGNVLTVTALRDERDDISGQWVVHVNRSGVYVPLTINVNMTALTLTFNPSTVGINNDNLTQVVNIGGSAIGTIDIVTNNLPPAVTATINQVANTISIVGIRQYTPAPIVGDFSFIIRRQGRVASLPISVNLTQLPIIFTHNGVIMETGQPIEVGLGSLVQTITVGGSATGNINVTRGALPDAVDININNTARTITFTGSLPQTGHPSIIGSFAPTIHVGTASKDLNIDLNLLAANELGDMAIGQRVKVYEGDNEPVTYIVIHQGNPGSGYSGFNNTTLLMRERVFSQSVGHTSDGMNDYSMTGTHTLLNNEYMPRLCESIRDKVVEVTIPSRRGIGNSPTVGSLTTRAFVLSASEVGILSTSIDVDPEHQNEVGRLPNALPNAEGSLLSFFEVSNNASSRVRRALDNRRWWLRTPSILENDSTIPVGFWTILSSGSAFPVSASSMMNIHPVIALPNDTMLEEIDSFFFPQNFITLDDLNTTVNIRASGNATGVTTINRGTLPSEVAVSALGNNVTFVATRPTTGARITGTSVVTITRDSIRGPISDNVAVTLNLSALPPTPVLTVTPNEITINDNNLIVTLNTNAGIEGRPRDLTVTLPPELVGNLLFAIRGQTITVAGIRPVDRLVTWNGTHTILVNRDGHSFPVSITVDLTSQEPMMAPTFGLSSITSPELYRVFVTNSQVDFIAEPEGTAAGVVTFNRRDLPSYVSLHWFDVEGVIHFLGEIPSTGAAYGQYIVVVVRQGIQVPVLVVVSLNSSPDTLSLSPNNTVLTNNILSQNIDIGGQGTIGVDRGSLPETVALSYAGNRITITARRPNIGEPNIFGQFQVMVVRDGLTGILTISANITPIAPLALSPSVIVVNNTNLVGQSQITNVVAGAVSLSGVVPGNIGVILQNNVITVTATRPPANTSDTVGTFIVGVTRLTRTEHLTIEANLTQLAPTLTLSPTATNITNNNLTHVVTIGGSAIGDITINTGTIPSWLSVVENNNVITIVSEPLAVGADSIDESFTISVTRQGVTQTHVINVFLSASLILSTHTVQLDDDNMTIIITASGTAVGDFTIDRGELPQEIIINTNSAENTITVRGTRRLLGQGFVLGSWVVWVTRQTVNATITVQANISPMPDRLMRVNYDGHYIGNTTGRYVVLNTHWFSIAPDEFDVAINDNVLVRIVRNWDSTIIYESMNLNAITNLDTPWIHNFPQVLTEEMELGTYTIFVFIESMSSPLEAPYNVAPSPTVTKARFGPDSVVVPIEDTIALIGTWYVEGSGVTQITGRSQLIDSNQAVIISTDLIHVI